MLRYRIVAQISLILAILNPILAAPIAVQPMQKIYEAYGDELVIAEDVAAMPTKWGELEASDKSTRMSLRSPTSQSEDATGSPQRSSLSDDGSTSSDGSIPHLPTYPLESGNSWLSIRPPGDPSSSGPSARPPSLPLLLQGSPSSLHSSSGSSERPPSLPLLLQGLPSPQVSSPGSSEVHLSPGSDWGPIEAYSPEKFTPSHHSSSFSSISLNSDNFMSQALPPSPSLPPIEMPPDDARFFNKKMMKKLGFVAGLALVGGAIGGIVGLHVKHHDRKDT